MQLVAHLVLCSGLLMLAQRASAGPHLSLSRRSDRDVVNASTELSSCGDVSKEWFKALARVNVSVSLGGHPKPASEGRLKTGQS